MNNYLKKNLQLLKKHCSFLDTLPEELSRSIRVENTPEGNTVWFNNKLIHSMYDPVKEGRVFANKINMGNQVFLYGFGLGYHIDSLLNKIGPNGFLLTIELNPDLLHAAMLLRDQSKILSSNQFHLVCGSNEDTVATEITKYMKKMQTSSGNFEILFHLPSFNNIPSGFPRLKNSLEVLLMERRFPALLGDLESMNYSLNKKIVQQSTGIKHLASKHQGNPGIIISAGPSLDNILPYLKQVRESAVFGCVDTALPILSREGIYPQYVFSLDPQEESFLYFQEDLENSAKLIFTPSTNSKVLHCYRGEKFIVFKKGQTTYKVDESIVSDKGSTMSGGSVSCLALDVFIQFGCNPLFLIGQDLSFPNNRNYSSFSNSNEQMLDRVNNHNSLNETHYAKSRENKTIPIKTNDGRKVATNQAMYSYLRSIEEIAAENPETTIYNLCSHGAQIDNVISLGSVKELLKFFKNNH